MSLILDALRKSEQERRQTESPAGLPPLLDVAPPRRRTPILLGAGVAVLGAAAAGLYWLHVERAAPPLRPVASPKAAVVAPAAPAAGREPAPAPELARNRFTAGSDDARRERTAAQERVVRPLAAEARVPVDRKASSNAAPAPAPASAAAAPAEAPAAFAPAALEDVKFLRAMPPEFQRALPELAVTIHIYAPNPADRILYINNHPYRPGERVGDGIVVEEIVQDGAVLSFRGQRFKLPRPS
ncbi:MAG TPA: general secretion pathway protein GspB [Burkholderiales bacterium]